MKRKILLFFILIISFVLSGCSTYADKFESFSIMRNEMEISILDRVSDLGILFDSKIVKSETNEDLTDIFIEYENGNSFKLNYSIDNNVMTQTFVINSEDIRLKDFVEIISFEEKDYIGNIDDIVSSLEEYREYSIIVDSEKTELKSYYNFYYNELEGIDEFKAVFKFDFSAYDYYLFSLFI